MAGLFSMTEVVLDLSPFVKMTSAEFERFCLANPEVIAELNPNGEVEIMAPKGFESGIRESLLIAALVTWSQRSGNGGLVLSSSGAVELPNKSVRSPDASWLSARTLAIVKAQTDAGFPRVVPDFVAEIRSSTDRLAKLQAKMEEYRAVGVALGWLLEPGEQRAWVYRPQQPVEEVDLNTHPVLSGDPVLVGFALDTRLFQVF